METKKRAHELTKEGIRSEPQNADKNRPNERQRGTSASGKSRRLVKRVSFAKRFSVFGGLSPIHPPEDERSDVDDCPRQMRHESIMKKIEKTSHISDYGGLFECFRDCSVDEMKRVAMAFCCPCCMAAKQAHMVSGADLSYAHWAFSLGCCCVASLGCMYILISAQTRDGIIEIATGRDSLGCESCCLHCCCHPCALVQQAKAMDRIGKLVESETEYSRRSTIGSSE